jgi:hypothetical protein
MADAQRWVEDHALLRRHDGHESALVLGVGMEHEIHRYGAAVLYITWRGELSLNGLSGCCP